MGIDLSTYTTQQNLINTIISKNKSVISGTGYSGTEPVYSDLNVDATALADYSFTSGDIYYPGVNAGAKEVFNSVSANNRFASSLACTRQDYYLQEDKELSILSNYNSYHQQVTNTLVKVPA